MYKQSDQNRATREFFRKEIQDLEGATAVVMKSAARALKRETQKEIRKNFNYDRSGSFHKAVKVYDLKSTKFLGPASYVRLGVPFMGVFQEGATITARSKNLIILLPPGKALGFKRITKGNRWNRVWNQIKNKARLIPTGQDTLVVINHNGTNYPIYKFTKQVTVGKKISFLEMSEEIGANLDSEINRLMNE